MLSDLHYVISGVNYKQEVSQIDKKIDTLVYRLWKINTVLRI